MARLPHTWRVQANTRSRVEVGLVLCHVDGDLAEVLGQIFGALDQQSLRLR